jgi:hypothetical protein
MLDVVLTCLRGARWLWLAVLALGCHGAADGAMPGPPTCAPDPLRDPDDKCPGGYVVVDQPDTPDAGLQRICVASGIGDGFPRCSMKR